MDKIRSKLIKKDILVKILLVFLTIQPLLDFAFLFKKGAPELFGFSPATLIRILGVFIICLLFIIINKNKKEYKYLIPYIILVILYAIVHHINALNFTDFYDGYDFGYNLFSELFYIVRMLMPLSIIYISSHLNVDFKKIEKLTIILILLICGTIIISNLTVTSIGSYSKETIKGSIICWFQKDRCNLSYYDLASKGFFNDPNRLASLLTLLTSIFFYVLIKHPTIINFIVIIVAMLGMYMLGTKVSTYGFAILSIISFIIYLFFTLIKKEEKYHHSLGFFFLALIYCSIALIPISPAINRTLVERNNILENEKNNNDELSAGRDEINQNIIDASTTENPNSNDETDIDKLLKQLTKEEKNRILLSYIQDNYLAYHINPQFILLSYPYYYDTEFWYNIMRRPINERENFRLIEELMLKRIKEINNNKYDDYLGITFTRMGNVFDLERDFISHYYTLGIIGMLLLVSPYIIILLLCILKILLKFEKKCNLKNTFYILGVGISLCAAFFSGNVLDGLIVTLILGFIIGQLINSVFDIKDINKE